MMTPTSMTPGPPVSARGIRAESDPEFPAASPPEGPLEFHREAVPAGLHPHQAPPPLERGAVAAVLLPDLPLEISWKTIEGGGASAPVLLLRPWLDHPPRCPQDGHTIRAAQTTIAKPSPFLTKKLDF